MPRRHRFKNVRPIVQCTTDNGIAMVLRKCLLQLFTSEELRSSSNVQILVLKSSEALHVVLILFTFTANLSRKRYVRPRLHDTAGCPTGCQNALTTGCIV